MSISCLLCLMFVVSPAQIITTVAGNGVTGYSGDGGPATAAELDWPAAVVIDTAGNLYITDELNHVIRKVNAAGIITTIAGNGTAGFSGDGGPATAAQLNTPCAAAVDRKGNLYISDFNNARVRIVNTAGIINTFAGNGSPGYAGDGGPATAAELWGPEGTTFDKAGNVYITDRYNNRVRVVSPAGIINTYAGTGASGYSGNGGPATAAELDQADGITIDAANNVYIGDQFNDRIRVITTAGIINTIAGTGVAGSTGNGGPATAAELYEPQGIAIAGYSGSMYLTDDLNQCIRIINSAGIINNYAGNGTAGFSGDGGPATAAELDDPTGMCSDSCGTIYIADRLNNRVRKVTVSSAPLTLTVTQTKPKCFGDTASASVVVSGGSGNYIYTWSPSTGTGASVSGLTAGTYTCSVLDKTGCGSGTATITVTQPTAINGTASVTNASCGLTNGSATVTASGGTGGFSYKWFPVSGAGNSASISGLSAGSYTCVVTDTNGCKDSVKTVVKSTSTLITTITNDTIISSGDSVTLLATGGGTYQWFPAQGLSCTNCPNPIATPSGTTTYCVLVSDSAGCSDTACVTISMGEVCNGEIFIPGAFAPEGDNKNNIAECVYGGCIKTMDFKIYDRWGNMVFESINQQDCWDGRYKGTLMNTAVFVYYFTAELYNGKTITQKGNITLVR